MRKPATTSARPRAGWACHAIGSIAPFVTSQADTDPGKTAVDAEPEPQILHRLLATTNKGEHLCARQFQSHRAAGFPGSQHRPEHPRPPKLPLAAEAAAQKTRDDPDVRCP